MKMRNMRVRDNEIEKINEIVMDEERRKEKNEEWEGMK